MGSSMFAPRVFAPHILDVAPLSEPGTSYERPIPVASSPSHPAPCPQLQANLPHLPIMYNNYSSKGAAQHATVSPSGSSLDTPVNHGQTSFPMVADERYNAFQPDGILPYDHYVYSDQLNQHDEQAFPISYSKLSPHGAVSAPLAADAPDFVAAHEAVTYGQGHNIAGSVHQQHYYTRAPQLQTTYPNMHQQHQQCATGISHHRTYDPRTMMTVTQTISVTTQVPVTLCTPLHQLVPPTHTSHQLSYSRSPPIPHQQQQYQTRGQLHFTDLSRYNTHTSLHQHIQHDHQHHLEHGHPPQMHISSLPLGPSNGHSVGPPSFVSRQFHQGLEVAHMDIPIHQPIAVHPPPLWTRMPSPTLQDLLPPSASDGYPADAGAPETQHQAVGQATIEEVADDEDLESKTEDGGNEGEDEYMDDSEDGEDDDYEEPLQDSLDATLLPSSSLLFQPVSNAVRDQFRATNVQGEATAMGRHRYWN